MRRPHRGRVPVRLPGRRVFGDLRAGHARRGQDVRVRGARAEGATHGRRRTRGRAGDARAGPGAPHARARPRERRGWRRSAHVARVRAQERRGERLRARRSARRHLRVRREVRGELGRVRRLRRRLRSSEDARRFRGV